MVFIPDFLDDSLVLLDQTILLSLVALSVSALQKLAFPTSALGMLEALGSGLLHLSSSNLYLNLKVSYRLLELSDLITVLRRPCFIFDETALESIYLQVLLKEGLTVFALLLCDLES